MCHSNHQSQNFTYQVHFRLVAEKTLHFAFSVVQLVSLNLKVIVVVFVYQMRRLDLAVPNHLSLPLPPSLCS